MSRKWDEMTPEQQRAIGEAALWQEDATQNPTTSERAYLERCAATDAAVRAAECPTWSANGILVVCSDGTGFYVGNYYGRRDLDAAARVFAAALSAHEREKRGLK